MTVLPPDPFYPLLNFVSKKATPGEQERISKAIAELKALAVDLKLECPALARAPEGDEGRWHMWWGNEKETISIDFEEEIPNELDNLYLFWRNRVNNEYSGGNSAGITPEFAAKIIKFRYPRE